MDTKPTSLKQLRKVVTFRIAYCWHDIGIQLGFTTEQLAVISSEQSTRQHPAVDCCKDMFALWKRKNKTVTTKKLIDVIEEGADNASFASELSKESKDILSTAYLEGTVTPRIADRWYDVGLQLDIPDYDLDGIKYLTNPSGEKCKDMLKAWLKRKDDSKQKRLDPTWRNMYSAMCALDMIKAAEEMKEELENKKVEEDEAEFG